MPDFESAFDTILGQFKAQMDTLRPLVPVAWPNLPYDPLEDFTPGTHDAWARITILGGDAQIASAGSAGHRRWRYFGTVVVQVFAPLGAGANTALAVADDVARALRGAATEGVTLNAAAIRPIGQDAQEAWYQVNVETPYRFDLLETTLDLSDFVADTRTSTFGTWEDPLNLGGSTGLYIWYVSGAEYRKTGSAPTSETDGTEWVTGAVV